MPECALNLPAAQAVQEPAETAEAPVRSEPAAHASCATHLSLWLPPVTPLTLCLPAAQAVQAPAETAEAPVRSEPAAHASCGAHDGLPGFEYCPA